VRIKLTYANVISTLALFLVLSGGAAYAASHLGKKTVGAKQLKPNAVTSAKIKKNAVTGAKIKNGAVTGAKVQAGSIDSAKIADGSITGTDISAPSMPFSQVVAKFRGSSSVDVPTTGLAVYPLDNATYSQAANENDTYVGAADVTIQSTCTGTRRVSAFILVDTNTASPSEADIVAEGGVEDAGTGTVTKRINIGGFGVRFEPGTATNHTISMALTADCTAGSGITATFGGVDVIGTK
jgi:hypothetical protein